MKNEVIETASHSEDINDAASHSSEEQKVRSYYEAFELEYPEQEEQEKTDSEEDEVDPAIDSEIEKEQELKGVTVKHNGQDVTVPDDQIDEHLQKGLNYDKVKGQAKQYESALDRIAKQQGYKDHADLIANLDAIERKRTQEQQDQFDHLRKQLRDDAEASGIDPNILDQYLDNHPLLKQAREVVERSEQEQQFRQQEQSEQQLRQGWEDLFRKYPQLSEKVDASTGIASWMTPEMQARIQRGYDPIDAYELVHRDTILADERKRAEQAVIKNQRLNKRSQVEKGGSAELEPSVPEELTSAFSLFGIDQKKAQKYAKNFE
ncbi:hypothetical protein FHR92_005154 [Fontibacillus solani]|uniref:Uncharacterized protein n=1 Tax=Fontibacillus solani TaxID=1572857 RepID=A0A7W3SYL1_9BACL|nr:hypothetical protein [Fontibacillus solani]MBA9088636.1 hypothetical protein [Fontibacillus solani]